MQLPASLPSATSLEATAANTVPVAAPAPTPPDLATKAIVRKMFEEWKRRNLSTEKMTHGTMTHDMAGLLVQLKKRGFYTDQAILREIDRVLRVLAVPADQCPEIAASILDQAKSDGEKAKKENRADLR